MGQGIRPAGRRAVSPSGAAAAEVRRHWEELRDAGHLDDPELESVDRRSPGTGR